MRMKSEKQLKMNLKEWMNLKALQILELITYIANIAKKLTFWKQTTKKKTNDTPKKEEGKKGK